VVSQTGSWRSAFAIPGYATSAWLTRTRSTSAARRAGCTLHSRIIHRKPAIKKRGRGTGRYSADVAAVGQMPPTSRHERWRHVYRGESPTTTQCRPRCQQEWVHARYGMPIQFEYCRPFDGDTDVACTPASMYRCIVPAAADPRLPAAQRRCRHATRRVWLDAREELLRYRDGRHCRRAACARRGYCGRLHPSVRSSGGTPARPSSRVEVGIIEGGRELAVRLHRAGSARDSCCSSSRTSPRSPFRSSR